MKDPLEPLLQSRSFVILDGGLATELERRGADLADPLWSGKVLIETPKRVVDVHRAFLEAGAEIFTTATYQLSFEALAARGVTGAEAAKLFSHGVAVAQSARDEFLAVRKNGPRPLVAASLGPYGAHLGGGAEYHGNYDASKHALRDFHARRLYALAASGADIFAFETIPLLEEAEAIIEALAGVSGHASLAFLHLPGRVDPRPRRTIRYCG